MYRISVICMIFLIVLTSVVSARVIEENEEYFGIVFPAGSDITFSNSVPSVVKLSEDIVINGIKCAKYVKSSCGCSSGNAEVAFYASGQVFYLSTAEPTVINGLKTSAYTQIVFYESGKLKKLTLQKPQMVGDIELRDQLCYYENGMIRFCTLSDDAIVQGIEIPEWSDVFFHENGRLAGVKLGGDMVFDGKEYESGTILEFSKRLTKARTRDEDWFYDWYY